MALDFEDSKRVIREFIGWESRLDPLGWGVSGEVFAGEDRRRVWKVLKTREGYNTEVESYKRLGDHGVDQVNGLTIPKMHASDERFRVIQMDFVAPPFLLDFAGVHFQEPDFEEAVWEQWHLDIQERFGPNAYVAYSVYEFLKGLDMYYLDLRQSNLNVTGLPGTEPWPAPDEIDP